MSFQVILLLGIFTVLTISLCIKGVQPSEAQPEGETMQTLISALRDIIGVPDFYIEGNNYSSTWDYGAMIEYMLCGILLCIVVASTFKFIRSLFA